MAIHSVNLINGATAYYADTSQEAHHELPVQFAVGDEIIVSSDEKRGYVGHVSHIGIFTKWNPTKALKGKYYVKIYVCRVGDRVLVKTEMDLLALNPPIKLASVWTDAIGALDDVR